MYQHWTFSHPSAQNEGRAARMNADLRVSIIIPFESWRLLWNLRSINISNTGILCGFDVTDKTSAQKALDLDTLLTAEPDVQIQINPSTDDLLPPMIAGRLIRKAKQPWGLELAFHFISENDDLALLMESLEHSPHESRNRQH
jgi:hypothetical protein